MQTAWNPRYLAYCAANGHDNSPEIMMEHDRAAFPGGCMCGFILWMADRWSEFCGVQDCRSTEQVRLLLGADCDRTFDEWLSVRVSELRGN